MKLWFEWLIRHRKLSTSFALMAATTASLIGFSIDQHSQIERLRGQGTWSEGPELGQVMEQLQQQIAQAQIEAAERNEADAWKINSIDLELSFTVKEERGADNSVDTKFLTVTDKSNLSAERVQKITFHLNPNQLNFASGPQGSVRAPAPKPKGVKRPTSKHGG